MRILKESTYRLYVSKDKNIEDIKKLLNNKGKVVNYGASTDELYYDISSNMDNVDFLSGDFVNKVEKLKENRELQASIENWKQDGRSKDEIIKLVMGKEKVSMDQAKDLIKVNESKNTIEVNGKKYILENTEDDFYDRLDCAVKDIKDGDSKDSILKHLVQDYVGVEYEKGKKFTKDEITKRFNAALKESIISEIRSLVQITVYWDSKCSFTLNFPGGQKVYHGSPEGFAKFLRQLGAKDSSLPRSTRNKTYMGMVQSVMDGKDPILYCWSNELANMTGMVFRENTMDNDYKEVNIEEGYYRLKVRGD